jgi:hypothetical protein
MRVLLLGFFFSSLLPLYAVEKFEVGKGAEFTMKSQGLADTTNLQIYIAESSFSQLSIEMHFSDQMQILEVTQRFDMTLKDKGPLSIEKGYFQGPDTKGALIMTKEFFEINSDGVLLTNFLFSKKEDINKNKIGEEIVEVPGGTLYCTHYQKKRADQTVDFWINDKVKPIGLVKLVSKGKKGSHNYTVVLNNILTGAKAKINTKKARPVTRKEEKLFPYLFDKKRSF